MSTDGPSGRPDEDPDQPREDRPAREPADHHTSRQPPAETRSRQEYYDSLSSGRSYEIIGFAALMVVQPASERHEWEMPLRQGEVDRCGLGVIDERAKKFSAAERRVAEHLAEPGPAVVSVEEGFGIYGRTADARVNGVPVEFKSLDPGASDRTVKAALNSAKGQARHAVIDARDSGLTEDQSSPRHPAIQWNTAREPP
jgi:Contact-dependent growth inhibition CdiA C-terminal domain